MYAYKNDVLGTLTGSLKRLLPNTINPQGLSRDELEARGIGAYTVEHPASRWWQRRMPPRVEGDKIVHDVVERPLEDVKRDGVERVNQARDARIEAGVEHGGRTYESSAKDRQALAEVAQLALMSEGAGADPADPFWHGGTEPFAWITADNEGVPMTSGELLDLAMAFAAHKTQVVLDARKAKNEVLSAESVAHVVDIVARWS